MNIFKNLTIILVVLLVPLSSNASDEKDAAYGIIKRVEDNLRSKTNRGTMRMKVRTKRWSRTMKMKFWEVGREKMLVLILVPKKDKGVASLKIKNNMWNYLPKVERTIKIPPSMMMQSWMGSDFTNDDIVKESSIISDYYHKLLKDDIFDDTNCYVIELIPKPDAAVVWGKLIYRVRKVSLLPAKVEFYDEHGELKRILTYTGLKIFQGHLYPAVMTMKTLNKPGNLTQIIMDDIVFDKPIDEKYFSIQYLKRVK